jgi:gamma-glutamyltranspeptidase/glutathione hydrolase/leukotriene-C4 hydrolase
MDAKTGIILNDEMVSYFATGGVWAIKWLTSTSQDDFSIPGVSNAFGLAPSPYNFIHPFKRPLSSSVPTIIENNGEVEFVSGASGGSRIITSTLQTLVNMMDFGMSLSEAVKDARYHHQLLPNEVFGFEEYYCGGN